MASPIRSASAHASTPDARLTRDSERAPRPAPRPEFGLTDMMLVLMALLWGVNYSFVKYGTSVLDPLVFNSIRVTMAALCLLLVAQLAMRSLDVAQWPSRRHALVLVALGVFGNGVYQVLFVEGIARTRAGDAALLVAASPAFMAILGRLRGTERISLRGVLGIAFSIAGIGLVVLNSSGAAATRQATLVGDAFILVGSVCWAIYTVLLQPHTHRVNGVQLSALTMTGGTLFLLIVAAPALLATPWARVPGAAWGAIAFSGFIALVIGYLLWYRGVRVIGPTRTAMYSNLQPVFAVLAAWIALSETPTAWQGLGAASIMTGILLTRA
jgi:drug/metabolite transporter (DMT)-like permease